MKSIRLDGAWLLFAAMAAVFIVMKISASYYAVSDENTYYKMGQLVAGGQTPYKDFFFAHLPLQIYIYALMFKAFGFNLLLLKTLSALAAVVAAAFVFAAVKDKLNSGIASAAAALFLFSYGTLLFSNFPTGAEFAVAFITAAFYFFMRRRFLLSGVLIGLGTAAYQLSIILLAVVAAAALLILKDKKAAIRLLAGFTLVLAAAGIPFLVAAKGEFIRQVLLYHLQKPADDADKQAIFLRILKTNALLFAAAAFAVISRYRNKMGVIMPAAIAAAYLAAFPLIKTAFNYYLLYALPFLAIAGSYGILWVYGFMAERARLSNIAAAAVIVAVIAVSGFFSVKLFIGYDFQDFPQAEEIAGYVRENSNEDQTIFGDDSTVPLISLLSGREIALNYVDNNAMRYRSGETGIDETLGQLQDSRGRGELKFVITRRIILDRNNAVDFGVSTLQKFTDFAGKCSLAKEFTSEWRGLLNSYLIYDCQKNSTAA